jgi:hypothetical protein
MQVVRLPQLPTCALLRAVKKPISANEKTANPKADGEKLKIETTVDPIERRTSEMSVAPCS